MQVGAQAPISFMQIDFLECNRAAPAAELWKNGAKPIKQQLLKTQ